MRSDLVFGALRKAENRYSLCRVCAKGTREIHVQAGRIEDTINEVLLILAKPMRSPRLDAPEHLAWQDAATAALAPYIGS